MAVLIRPSRVGIDPISPPSVATVTRIPWSMPHIADLVQDVGPYRYVTTRTRPEHGLLSFQIEHRIG